jgi:putative spermidine/putrescine transport system permease protein
MTARFDPSLGREALILVWPGLMIALCFLVPFGLLLAVSVGHHDPQGLWTSAFQPSNYLQIFDPAYLGTLGYSAMLGVLVAAVSTGFAFPLTYFITGLGRRAQIFWLILLLSTLCLSEVLIAFAWQVMLAKRIGLSEVFVMLGLLAEPQSLSPGFGAVLACLVYLVLPYTVLLIYPALSRLDRHVPEAARTMGASPFRVFLTVILPMMRAPLFSSAILATVFTIGTYVAPSVLGRPENWTIAILIGQAALNQGNLPLAAVLAIALLVVTLTLSGTTLLVARRQEAVK